MRTKPRRLRRRATAGAQALHEEWIERVVLPAVGGLTREQRQLARKILLRKRDVRVDSGSARQWDADRRLELLMDYELLLEQGFKGAEAHRLLQDLHGTSKIPTYLREARKLFPRKTKKR